MKDFSNQDLRGRSFREYKTLEDADFSTAKLHGTDFRGMELKRVKFSEAKMGRTHLQTFFQIIFNLMLGLGISFYSAFISLSSYRSFESLVKEMYLRPTYLTIFVFTGLQVGLLKCFLFAFKQQSWRILLKDILVGAVVIFVIANYASPRAGGVAMFFMVFLLGTSIMLALSGVLLAIVSRSATTIALLLAFFSASDLSMQSIKMDGGSLGNLNDELFHSLLRMFFASIASSSLYILFGQYMIKRACKLEEAPFLPLRRWLLTWRSRGATNFTNATFKECDFRNTNVKYIRYPNARFIRCRFDDTTENLNLADVRNTPLDSLAVREVILHKTLVVKDFSYQNLRGVIFAGLNLSGCNFYHADISEADFRDCDLRDCDLSEMMALGTWFDNAIFTGAIIDNWSIDKTTQFNNAMCDFVYLKRDKSERNPPEGEFEEGDFAKLYQEIANTVDFIAHTPAELQALLRAIEKIKAEGGEIFIQQMERKADSVFLRVQGEGNLELDKAAIYAEVQRDKEIELKAIKQAHENENKLLDAKHELEKEKINREWAEKSALKAEKTQDLLADLLKKTSSPNVTVENKFVNQDNSRPISHSPIQNSAVNLGDNNPLHNQINGLSSEYRELKQVLTDLAALLEDQRIEATDKSDVEGKLANLCELTTKPAEERKSAGSKIIANLKDVTSIFKDLPEVGVKYGALLAKLMSML